MEHQLEPELISADPRSEDNFRDAIAVALRSAVDGDRTVVGTGFGLDVAVFTENTAGAAQSYFIEAKVYKSSSQRINIGPPFNRDPQHRLQNQIGLFFDDATRAFRRQSQISLLDRSLRWALADCSLPAKSPRFVFFSCKDAPGVAARGQFTLTKQNNFSLPRCRARLQWLTWDELLARIAEFIGGRS
jgi:hypothetical protein